MMEFMSVGWQFPGDGSVSISQHFDKHSCPEAYNRMQSVPATEFADLSFFIEFTKHILGTLSNDDKENHVRLVLWRWCTENDLPGPGDSVLRPVRPKVADVRILARFLTKGEYKSSVVTYEYEGFGFFHRQFRIVAGNSLGALISHVVNSYGVDSHMVMRMKYVLKRLLTQTNNVWSFSGDELVIQLLLQGIPTPLQRLHFSLSREQQLGMSLYFNFFFAIVEATELVKVAHGGGYCKILLWQSEASAHEFLNRNCCNQQAKVVPFQFEDFVDTITESLGSFGNRVSRFTIDDGEGGSFDSSIKEMEYRLRNAIEAA